MSDLGELEQRLRELSHSTEALQAIRESSDGLKKTNLRQSVFNTPGALIVRPSLTYEEGRRRGLLSNEEDAFVLLQGDVIATETAYHMGARLTGMRFLVANSTCDLVPDRRSFAALLPIQPIRPGDTPAEREATKQLLAELLRFVSTRRMYLPPLPGDASNKIIGNAVEFDRIAQARLEDVLAAERIASLSLVGWRIFGSHLRVILSRTGDSEVKLRNGWR